MSYRIKPEIKELTPEELGNFHQILRRSQFKHLTFKNRDALITPKQISFMIEIVNNIGATLTSLELPEIKDKQPNPNN